MKKITTIIILMCISILTMGQITYNYTFMDVYSNENNIKSSQPIVRITHDTITNSYKITDFNKYNIPKVIPRTKIEVTPFEYRYFNYNRYGLKNVNPTLIIKRK